MTAISTGALRAFLAMRVGMYIPPQRREGEPPGAVAGPVGGSPRPEVGASPPRPPQRRGGKGGGAARREKHRPPACRPLESGNGESAAGVESARRVWQNT